jgi:hypothetical protein
VANALNEFVLRFKPMKSGLKQIFLHVVDVEFHILLSAWLISAKAEEQAITKQFGVRLKVGKPSTKVLNKLKLSLNCQKLGYINPQPGKRTLTLSTNKPHLLSFKEPKMEIGPREEKQLTLIFKASKTHGNVPILVFLNDSEFDKTEECIAINAQFGDD